MTAQQKPMNNFKRLLSALLCVVLLSTCVYAGEINPGKTCALTVRCKHTVEDVSYAIWRVAEVDADVRFRYVSPFKNKGFHSANDHDDWEDTAETLAGYVEREKIAPLAIAETNARGNATFEKLKTGLYLVLGEPYTYDGKTYEQDSFLIALPTRSDNTQPWEYDVTTIRKPAGQVEKPTQKVDVEVLKIWSGDDGILRPASVTVQLLQNGQVYDTVTLNRRNNWEHRWTELPAGFVWRVTEAQVPTGYSVLVQRNGNKFVIINTYDVPEEPQKPKPPEDFEDIPDDDVPLDKPTLPETGTSQWIVPLLLSAGALLFLLGLLRRRQEG